MGAILDPTNHSTYFDEIRSLISPDHDIDQKSMPDKVIDQFGYLGRAETAVLRATNLTSADLKPTGNDASAVPTDNALLTKRQFLFVIQALTAYYLLSPQVISTGVADMNVTFEKFSIESRKLALAQKIGEILPEVAPEPDTHSGSSGQVVGTQIIVTQDIF